MKPPQKRICLSIYASIFFFFYRFNLVLQWREANRQSETKGETMRLINPFGPVDEYFPFSPGNAKEIIREKQT